MVNISTMSNVDILVFGSHPDDIELSCGGTILLHSNMGYKIGLIDLTRGELGTRGTPEIRLKESKIAAENLGVEFRENLELEDGFFQLNDINKKKVITKIRQYVPSVVICNAPQDRHPDHGRGSQLVVDSCFLSGLEKIKTFHNGEAQNTHRPKNIFHYIQYDELKPDFLIDISKFMSKKMDVIKLYKSQFYNPESTESKTLISEKGFLESVVSRSANLGRIISADFAEGFISKKIIGTDDITKFI